MGTVAKRLAFSPSSFLVFHTRRTYTERSLKQLLEDRTETLRAFQNPNQERSISLTRSLADGDVKLIY